MIANLYAQSCIQPYMSGSTLQARLSDRNSISGNLAQTLTSTFRAATLNVMQRVSVTMNRSGQHTPVQHMDSGAGVTSAPAARHEGGGSLNRVHAESKLR